MTQKIFTEIYENNFWGSVESVSGPGSEIKNTKNLRDNLSHLIKALNIKFILDVPCGDMNWMKEVDLKGIEYEGWDIVSKIIEQNKALFSKKPNFNFFCKDALKDKISYFDLIICRDMIIHFPFSATWQFLQKIINSGSKYILITSCRSNRPNVNVSFGGCYPANLRKPPFNFHKEMFYIKEEEEGKYMALYRVRDLRCYVKNYLIKTCYE